MLGCARRGRERSVAAVVLACAIAASGCAAGRAFRSGEAAARGGNWDAAVEYYRLAVQDAPDRPEYRIALERAMLNAARAHLAAARERELAGDPSGALLEYRQAYALDPSNGEAAVKIANLQQALRERIEAAREPAPIEAMRELARLETQPPLLDPASDELLVLEFTDTSLSEILEFLGDASGINVTYDEQFEDQPASLDLADVTFEEALNHLLSSQGAFYKVLSPTTIIVVPDTPQNRAAYDEQAIRTFYISHGDVAELVTLLTAVVRTPEMPVTPQFVANPTANSLTVRASTSVLGIVEQVISANDKPPAEIVIDVEILEVNRERAKQYGLDLSQYSIGAIFSPERPPGGAPAAEGDDGAPAAQGQAPSSFNLNTISRGVSLADFYTAIPAAVVNFLEQDTHTRLVAQPQLRGQEGAELTLNLGQEIPVPTTAFTPLAAGGASFNPLTSYTYRPIGVIINMTPRVTYENEIILDLEVENSTLGPSILVAGQSLPTFGTRNVETRLRLRDGESNLLAGLLREQDRQTLKGIPGLMRLPIFKQLFSANDQSVQTTDIVMLLTPRIVRGHQLTQQDVSPIHIGTQRNIGITGPPPRIATAPEVASATGPAADALLPATASGTAEPPAVTPPRAVELPRVLAPNTGDPPTATPAPNPGAQSPVPAPGAGEPPVEPGNGPPGR